MNIFKLLIILLLTITNVLAEEHDHHESSLEINEDNFQQLGLELKSAKPAQIIQSIEVAGRIVPVDEKIAHVSPRFPGVVKEVKAKVGDTVRGDTLLAVVQNNQNLQSFSLYSAIPGLVIKRHATIGETVNEDSVLFIVADLSQVWAELAVYKQDENKIRLNQEVAVSIASDQKSKTGNVIFFSPITDESTQSRLVRVLLDNSDGHFSPGTFVAGKIAESKIEAPVTVDLSAVQKIEGADTVFIRDEDHFNPQKVSLGKSDGKNVEILSGLNSGEIYASGNTFILKAELGKSEAEHEH